MMNYDYDAEAAFLKEYNISNFKRPSVATDMVIFSIMEDGEKDNYRKLPKKSLKVLLIRRGNYPYKGFWALPGGFCVPNEDIYETARRELYEETGVEAAYMQLGGIFGDLGRDPRGWIISNTFVSLINGEQSRLRAGTDAWEARWFTIEVNKEELKKEVDGNDAEIETIYSMALINEEIDLILRAKIKEKKQFHNYHETAEYSIIDSDSIGFDHSKLIMHSFLFLRKSVKNDLKVAFDLMPELFTLTQLQNTFELILGEKLLTANFRRKISDYVIETSQSIEGNGHRPAKLFRRNVEKFYD